MAPGTWSATLPGMSGANSDDPEAGSSSRGPSSTGLPASRIRARSETFFVATDDVGQRLDQVLPRYVEGLSRRQARTLLDLGGVFVNGTRTKTASRPMQARDEVTAYIGGALQRATKQVGTVARDQDASRLPSFDVMFEDEHIVVVNKPAGLLTAPTPESDRNNLSDLLARRTNPKQPIFVVHRIDLQTSGVLVFAKTPAANRALGEKFVVHDIQRLYQAVVHGAFPDDIRVIDRPVAGKRAVTHVEVHERIGDHATVLQLRLETGRTHQIRLHSRAVRHPVLGDPDVAPSRLPPPPRMALHAKSLGFDHPIHRQPVHFAAPWPEDLQLWLSRLRVWAPKGREE